jgi:hypothetical protein
MFYMGADYSGETWFPEYNYAIGDPTGPYTVDANGVYRRSFSQGLALVNPTASTETVSLGATHSGSGLTSVTSVTMAPQTRLVLTLDPTTTTTTTTPPPTTILVAVGPGNTSPPTMSGTPVVGQTLIASPGTWSGTPSPTYAYTWKRCSSSACTALASGGSSYTVVTADTGYTLEVSVTATNSAGSATATSVQTAPVSGVKKHGKPGAVAHVTRASASGAPVRSTARHHRTRRTKRPGHRWRSTARRDGHRSAWRPATR